jgi:broad specificity phosphatase PhoE
VSETTEAQTGQGSLVLLRHGETEWSRTGRHTGRTDIALTVAGEARARRSAELMVGRTFAEILTSPLQRARRTAQLAGLGEAAPVVVEDNLVEWDYGGYEGMTTNEIRQRVGHPWTVFDDGVIPGATPGESIDDVAARCRKVIERATPALATGDVALVGHGHCLRILTAVFLGQEPRFGSRLLLDAGAVSVLRRDRDVPVIESWNRTVE